MSSIPLRVPVRQPDYPTSDGRPMAETDWHRKLMTILIEILETFFAGQRVYVSGNLLIYYERGNRRRHVSPDVFVVPGVESRVRDYYLVWEERHAPEVAIELTSSSTREEDRTTKMTLYQDTLKVREYYLFDPRGEWLTPPLHGYRLYNGKYRKIRPRRGRLPSEVLGLELERRWRDAATMESAHQSVDAHEGGASPARKRSSRAGRRARRVGRRARRVGRRSACGGRRRPRSHAAGDRGVAPAAGGGEMTRARCASAGTRSHNAITPADAERLSL